MAYFQNKNRHFRFYFSLNEPWTLPEMDIEILVQTTTAADQNLSWGLMYKLSHLKFYIILWPVMINGSIIRAFLVFKMVNNFQISFKSVYT